MPDASGDPPCETHERSEPSSERSPVNVFVEDPDLLAGVVEEHRPAFATQRVWGITVDRGPLRLAHEVAAPASLGLLVLDGFLCMEVKTEERSSYLELLGPGDLLRPWDELQGDCLPSTARATALTVGRMAVLDARFARMVAAHPEITAVLMQRLVLRTRRLAVQHAIGFHPVERRLELFFWHLADRWGRVTPDGVRLDLPLTHGMLGRCVHARRPSVTTCLSRLREKGAVERVKDGWLLHGEPPAGRPGHTRAGDPQAAEGRRT